MSPPFSAKWVTEPMRDGIRHIEGVWWNMFFWMCILVLAATANGVAEPVDAWAELQAVVQSASQTPAEKVTLSYDPSKRLLRVERELQLNPSTLRRNIQMVLLDRLAAEIPIEGVGRIADPWVKVRTADGRKHVRVSTHREINGEDASFDRSDEMEDNQSFLIIPCAPRDVKKLRDALQAFLRAEQKR